MRYHEGGGLFGGEILRRQLRPRWSTVVESTLLAPDDTMAIINGAPFMILSVCTLCTHITGPYTDLSFRILRHESNHQPFVPVDGFRRRHLSKSLKLFTGKLASGVAFSRLTPFQSLIIQTASCLVCIPSIIYVDIRFAFQCLGLRKLVTLPCLLPSTSC